MVKRRSTGRKRVGTRRVARTPRAAKVAYKKCIVSAIKRAKISTPKQARKVFTAAAKKCRLACLVQKRCSAKTGRPLKRTKTAKKSTRATGRIRVRKPTGGFYYRKRASRR